MVGCLFHFLIHLTWNEPAVIPSRNNSFIIMQLTFLFTQKFKCT